MIKEIKRCPLCNSKNYKEVKSIYINDLIDMWVSKRGFNPISIIYNNKVLIKRKCDNCGLYYYNYHISDSKKLYENLEKVDGYYPVFRPTYKIALEIIKKINPKDLMEIGSGNGSFLEYINNFVPNVIGNEYNKNAVKLCQSKGLNVISKPIKMMKSKFDVVCHHEVLEHVFGTKKFIKENIKLLRKGGKLIIGTPDPESILAITGKGELHYPPHHQFEFSKQTFNWMANKYDLRIYCYKKTKVEQRHYEKYIEITKDNITYEECKKRFTGHSHVVIFEKLK